MSEFLMEVGGWFIAIGLTSLDVHLADVLLGGVG
jgi:hypothetical protein